jgi:hypothetical protein
MLTLRSTATAAAATAAAAATTTAATATAAAQPVFERALRADTAVTGAPTVRPEPSDRLPCPE